MKKIILLAAFAVTTSIASAQVSFGIQLGANIAMGKLSYDDAISVPAALTNDPKVGIIGGFLAEIPLGSNLAFRPELNFIQKGSKSNAFTTSQLKRTLNYIELPLNVVYKLDAGSGNFFFGLGPTLAFGISGKDKYSDTNDPNDPTLNYTSTVKFDGKKDDNTAAYSDKDHLKAFDFGANILAGYQLGMGVFFKLGYTYNFMELDPNHSDPNYSKSSYKNRGFNVCVGYMIGGSKSSKKKD